MKQRTLFFLIILLLFSGCASTGINPKEELRAYGTINLQYPIVLVHGIARNDTNKSMHPWGRIPEILQDYGVAVYTGNTDAWGDVESNAELLKETIDKILRETNKEKVNIIAHSKGGIDSRYVIWNYDYGDKVASLTTVSTPHHGAELADLLYNSKILHTKMAEKSLNAFEKMFRDKNPDIYRVDEELTTEYMTKFNEKVTMDSRVYYQCLYSIMNDPPTDKLFASSYQFIKKINGNNDGIVSEYSARWGDNIKKIPGSISHEQISDHPRARIPGMAILNIYLDIAHELSAMGF
jgi:triacylglycerol lipase